ncbi:nectin-1 precursor [Mus musculus]|uniref:Nectin-1 n=2 Tax=Murinae TaxID=39107 RepID=NECT1_MOUSE|nr:nectin-1 precursor [Mus musculus]Q9JKF6.3 RecName: Full=Nectin-1; AltName: Full=Herpes virus entry mediator C; Short=Herpesvirus entry mediator C; Short=HveC; AltName: Full=Nectin cell adhesion molecule 1; AltName: Full=Poliovirus receptor-related protein 1; AltName: CD_antigen=CD111; Flags: Precursor [Mus musculus]AAH60694.1 Poliovirus receptor-related 1 [Mus musculus]|eukprot:NP_067399.2 nectin-1 precursor [Mus musculus]
MARMGLAGAAGRWWGLALGLTAFFLPGTHTQVVQVNDSMYGFIGTDVVLHCSFANPLPSVKITQVTWQKASNGSKQNMAIYNPTMGVSVLPPYEKRVEFLRPSFIDGTIRLSGLELEDEGMYICEFATFPTGNRESQLNLTVMAKPTNWIEGTRAVLRARKGQDDKVLVATCTSANGKPPSAVSWETRLKGEAEYQEIRNPNGTVTVISRYRLVPSREAHRQSLACIVNYHLDRFRESLTLNVQYEPEVTIEGFDGNWYLQRTDVKLTCKADANPPATEYHWTTLNGSLPKGVEAQNRTLFFRGPITYSLAGTYICEATNPIGTRSGQVEVNITEFPYTPTPEHGRRAGQMPTAIIGGVAGSVLLVLIVVGGIIVALRRRRHTFKGDYSTKKHVYGNGYSKAGIPQHHPPMAQNLQYPDDSDDEKKAGPLGGSSYEEEEEEEGGGGGERKVGGPHPKYDEDAKRPYFTVDEAEARQDGYGDRTLGYQYDPEQLDLAENMVSQNDGSFISKKEWYV